MATKKSETKSEKPEVKAEKAEEKEVSAADLGTSADSTESEKKRKKELERQDLIERRLEAFKEFKPTLKGAMGADDRLQKVENVPADMVVTWATDPRIDKGQCISLYRGLGFTPVLPEEVTANLHDDTRLHVHNFEVYNNMVCRGGGVLMIGYRQYRDERKAYARIESRRRIDTPTDQTENMERNETFASGSLRQ